MAHDADKPTATGAATPSGTDVLDKHLAAADFFDRIRLVKLEGQDDNKLWPALKYESKRELLDVVETDEAVPYSLKIKIFRWYQHQKQMGNIDGGSGIAYLLGMGTVEQSFLALATDDMVESFDSRIDEIRADDEYKSNAKFQHALGIIDIRMHQLQESSDDDDDSKDETVALSSPLSPAENRQLVTSSLNCQADAKKEAIDVAVADSSKAIGTQITAEKKKRKRWDDGKESKPKKTNTKQSKTPNKMAKKPPIVTPHGPSKLNVDKRRKVDDQRATDLISPTDGPYSVMTNAEAWQLLGDKFALTHRGENYYLLSQEKPVATSMAMLRNDLCVNGLPKSIVPLSEREKIDIARWVRYTHVAGLTDGGHIAPEDLGRPIANFMTAWGILCKNFGCGYSPGRYTVPNLSHGEKVETFEHTDGVERHFARFGIQCIPNNDDKLSKKDRLSLDIFFATPKFSVLNTFDRDQFDEKGNAIATRRKRSRISYRE